MDVIQRIRQLMNERCIESSNQLAKLSGVPQTTLSANLRRQYSPSIANLELLCKYFGITMAQLFADPENDTFYPLTEKQQELIGRWDALNEKQQDVILELMDAMI